MEHDQWIKTVISEITSSTQAIDREGILHLAEKITAAHRIFLFGSGRTGLITQAFGLRLAQLGLPVYLVSHPTTPGLEKQDLLVLVSGSGKTARLLLAAERALKIGAQIFLVTQNGDSPMGMMIQEQLIIPSSPKPDRVLNGTLFEMALLINLDAVINQLLNLSGQHFEDLSARHANLE